MVVALDGFVGEGQWPRRDSASACRAGSFSSPTIAAVSASGLLRRRLPAREQGRQPSRLAVARPPNNDYFSGPVHVARVQTWRAAHPGYARGRVRPSRALQDLLTPQVTDAVEESANRADLPEASAVVALQDLLSAETPLLAGLVAHLFQPALQG